MSKLSDVALKLEIEWRMRWDEIKASLLTGQGIVMANDFEVFAVARCPAVRNKKSVEGKILAAKSREANAYHPHCCAKWNVADAFLTLAAHTLLHHRQTLKSFCVRVLCLSQLSALSAKP